MNSAMLCIPSLLLLLLTGLFSKAFVVIVPQPHHDRLLTTSLATRRYLYDKVTKRNDQADRDWGEELKEAKETLQKLVVSDNITNVISFFEKVMDDDPTAFDNIPKVKVAIDRNEPELQDNNALPTLENAEVSMDRFLSHLVKTVHEEAEKDNNGQGYESLWNSFSVTIINSETKSVMTLVGRFFSCEDLIQDIEENKFDYQTGTSIVLNINGKSHEWEPPFTLARIDTYFQQVKGDIKELEALLQKTQLPLSSLGTGMTGPDLKYVSSEGAGIKDVPAYQQTDKSFAIVVAGESGSGKSVYSCLSAGKAGYRVLYCVPRLEDMSRKPPDNEFPLVQDKLVSLIIDKQKEKKQAQEKEVETDCSNAVEALYAIKSYFNIDRDTWAAEVLEKSAWETVKSNDNAKTWFKGEWTKSAQPMNVAIILDEATDIGLVSGLVASVRRLHAEYLNRLAQNKVQLLLVGTGLENIRDGRVGTNPELSHTVVMKQPALDQLLEAGKISQPVYAAATGGLFSSVMSTNARMLFRSVLRILTLELHSDDATSLSPKEKDERLKSRLLEIAGFRPLMDHGPRFYVSQNTIANLTSETRSCLLKEAFLYHLREAILSSKKRGHESTHKNQEAELRMVERMGEVSEEVFSRGLAARSGTSSALKFLACFGLSCKVRTSFGDQFEELTALHYMRLMEVQGYQVRRSFLNHAWPPPRTSSNETIAITDLNSTLVRQEETEDADFTIPDGIDKFCIVFSQGKPNAQGGDILALVVDKEKEVYELECIQCKHVQEFRGGQEIREKWWRSLGVAVDKDNQADLAPCEGGPGYSYAGLERFRSFVSKKIGKNVKLGSRILATSLPTPESNYVPIPENNELRIWFREMLEPTISTFQLGPTAD